MNSLLFVYYPNLVQATLFQVELSLLLCPELLVGNHFSPRLPSNHEHFFNDIKMTFFSTHLRAFPLCFFIAVKLWMKSCSAVFYLECHVVPSSANRRRCRPREITFQSLLGCPTDTHSYSHYTASGFSYAFKISLVKKLSVKSIF